MQYLGGKSHHPDHELCKINDTIIVQVHVPDDGIYLLLSW